MGTYLAAAVIHELDQAQATLEQHIVTGPDGRCRGCAELEPCGTRAHVQALFVQYGRLPRRRPGATGMDLRHAEATGNRSWFAN